MFAAKNPHPAVDALRIQQVHAELQSKKIFLQMSGFRDAASVFETNQCSIESTGSLESDSLAE